jgi:hypothetical protein
MPWLSWSLAELSIVAQGGVYSLGSSLGLSTSQVLAIHQSKQLNKGLGNFPNLCSQNFYFWCLSHLVCGSIKMHSIHHLKSSLSSFIAVKGDITM